MDNPALQQRASGDRSALEPDGNVLDVLHVFRGNAVPLRPIEHATDLTGDCRLIGFAQARGRLDERLQHRLEIERRATDDLEHVGGGGLLLKRFAQLVEQARILDRDHRLVGEGGYKFDLLFREWLRPAPRQHDDADRTAFAQQRNAEHGTSTNFSYDIAQCVVRIVQNIGNLDYFAFDNGSPQNGPAPRHKLTLPHMFIELLRKSVARNIGVGISYWPMDRSSIGLAQPGCRLDERAEHCLQVEG